jgi:hypothetical protein
VPDIDLTLFHEGDVSIGTFLWEGRQVNAKIGKWPGTVAERSDLSCKWYELSEMD